MAALGTATLGTISLTGLTATAYGTHDYGVLLDGNVAFSEAGGAEGFDVPEVGIIWPNGVNVG